MEEISAMSTESKQQTKNKGAIKGGQGQYTYDMYQLKDVEADINYSTGIGGVVEGERIQVGLIRKPRGTGSQIHMHPNEQWNFVLKGRLKVHVNGVDTIAGPGTVIYMPANTPHATIALGDEDVEFFVCKDLTHHIAGTVIDPTKQRPAYMPGFDPDETK